MAIFFTLLYLLLLTKTEAKIKNKTCNDFQANFTMKDVIGPWHVVAIIPEKLFPDTRKKITCYKVEFSETDTAGLRWLVNNTLQNTSKTDTISGIKGTILRQRYHSERPFDVWSRSIAGVNGCFQQVISLDATKSKLSEAHTHDDMMQLHLLQTNDKTGPFLLQMLWGRMISAVIYRQHEGVTQDELKPVFELMSKLRGPQRIPRICTN
ncbi:unnamed protein product [Parnassius mnemosyne]|uniref:Uncharacterized protein n=1 Tax=Parnassius mnemosyne TaxID=213953 RepID=A0AAV1LDW6_9NEOP